ncbi:MAG: PLP-dependent transferase [Dorea sp.]
MKLGADVVIHSGTKFIGGHNLHSYIVIIYWLVAKYIAKIL